MITRQRGPFTAELIRLSQWVEIGGQRSLATFSTQLLWRESSESQILFMHGGKVLQEGTTFTDFYGSSKEAATAEALKIATHYRITVASTLSLAVRTIVRRIPYIRTRRCEDSNITDLSRLHEVEYVPDSWLIERDGKQECLSRPLIISTEVQTVQLGPVTAA